MPLPVLELATLREESADRVITLLNQWLRESLLAGNGGVVHLLDGTVLPVIGDPDPDPAIVGAADRRREVLADRLEQDANACEREAAAELEKLIGADQVRALEKGLDQLSRGEFALTIEPGDDIEKLLEG